MSENPFDKFIKDKLENYPSTVPADMWSRIMPGKEPGKRPVYLKWLALVLAISGVVCSGIYLSGSRFNDNNSISSNKPASYIPAATINETAQPHSAESRRRKISSGINSPIDKKDIVENPAPAKDEISPGSRIAYRRKGSSVTPVNRESSHNVLVNYSKGKTTGAGDVGLKINSFNQVPYNRLEKKQSRGLQNMPAVFNQFLSASSIPGFKKVLYPISDQERKAAGLSNKELEDKLKSFKSLSPVDCPSSRSQRNHNVYIEVFAAPEYAKKILERGNGITDEYLRSKDSSESFRGAFTAGFRISKTIGENLLIKTGLQYSQIKEKFDYRSPVEKRLITVITIRTIIRGPNDTLRVSDTSTVEQMGYRVVKSYNRYHNVDIPLILSYEFGGETLKFSINAGVILNVYSWQHGQVLDTSRTPVAFNKVTSGQFFKRNIGVGVYGGVSIIKKVGDKIEAFAEPSFRYNFSSMTKEKYPFTQKFNLAGINLGVRYKLSAVK